MIRYLLSKGADVHIANDKGKTILMKICKDGLEQSLQELLQWPIKINQTDNQGDTPLHYAARQGQDRIIKYLLKKGAKIRTNKNGLTPLEEAGRLGQAAFCHSLIGNPTSPRGKTHISARSRKREDWHAQ